jgi:hypothetical protein
MSERLPHFITAFLNSLTGFMHKLGGCLEAMAGDWEATARARGKKKEDIRKAIASAEALIPTLNSLKFLPGGIADTASRILMEPSPPLATTFQRQLNSSFQLVHKLRLQIANSPELEAQSLDNVMQFIRSIEGLKAGVQFDLKNVKLDRYLHGATPLTKQQREMLHVQLTETVAEVNAQIDDAVKKLQDFVRTSKK